MFHPDESGLCAGLCVTWATCAKASVGKPAYAKASAGKGGKAEAPIVIGAITSTLRHLVVR